MSERRLTYYVVIAIIFIRKPSVIEFARKAEIQGKIWN